MKKILQRIKQLKRREKYITKIPDLIERFHTQNISILSQNEILQDIYSYNISLYRDELSRKKEIHQLEQFRKEPQNHRVEQESKITSGVVESPSSFSKKVKQVDISFYLDSIENCQNLDELTYLLPKKNTDNFHDVISSILLWIQKEKLEISRLIYSEKNLMDKGELQEFRKDVEKLNYLTKRIQEYYEQETRKQNQEIQEETQNQLIFLEKTNGKNGFIASIDKDIEKECYHELLELLNSIMNGTFKNVKTLIHNNKVKGISEVKLNQSRIIFKRIEKDIFVVIDAFTKKCDSDSIYFVNLENKISEFYQQKEQILELIKSEQYLEEQAKETEYVLDFLNSNKRKGKR